MDAENREIPIVEDDMGEGFKEVVQIGEREDMLNEFQNRIQKNENLEEEKAEKTPVSIKAEKKWTEALSAGNRKNLIRISHINHIKEGVRAGLFVVLDPRPSDQHIGMFHKAYKIQRIRPNGTVILKPAGGQK